MIEAYGVIVHGHAVDHHMVDTGTQDAK
ncbi:hypothetical protein SPHINGO391_440092 [Sphingomonas aurantiaca]|uniref:Uncharacterized protein n=1 Tax=Sphingomonas aurantiaca TaxID=185949 RepID=A0A5E7Z3Q7_9SPHN|nr:hypothetical protein SPHINGO391_440092 [Sphingomonas aurantiaca]